jgi:hypothetical protein
MARVYAMAAALDKRADTIRQVRARLNELRVGATSTEPAAVAAASEAVAALRKQQPLLLEEAAAFTKRVHAFDRLTVAVASPSEAAEARDIGQWVALSGAHTATQDAQIAAHENAIAAGRARAADSGPRG